jgi:hypothetical protein
MVRTLLNIQLLFYGMMILEKLPILINLKTFYNSGNEMNVNVMPVTWNDAISLGTLYLANQGSC